MILASASPVSLGLAAAAALAYAVPALAARALGAAGARRVLLLAWLLHGAQLAWGVLGSEPRFGFAPALSITVWLVLTVYAIESQLYPQMTARWALAGFGTLAILLALLFPGAHPPATGSPLLPLHWALGIAAYGLLAAAVAHGWLMQRADGRIAFDQVLDFNNETTRVPHLVFTDPDGQIQYDGPLAQMATDPGPTAARNDDVALAVLQTRSHLGVTDDEPRDYLVGWRIVEGELRVILSGAGLDPREIKRGEEVPIATGILRYEGFRDIPAIQIDDMPGAPEGAVVQMVESSAGTALVVSGIEDGNVELATGETFAASDGYTYEFERRVEASGLDVRRDPGDVFIWVAVGMAMVGLGVTFYVPRRRLWVKVTPERTYFAGTAERTTRLGRELRLMGSEIGSPGAVLPEDSDE